MLDASLRFDDVLDLSMLRDALGATRHDRRLATSGNKIALERELNPTNFAS